MEPSEKPHLSRRRFLKFGIVLGGASFVGVRFFLPFSLSRDSETRILSKVYSTITGEEGIESVQAAVKTMGAFIATLAPRDRFELRVALQLIEHSPLPFHGMWGRFSTLAPPARVRCLKGWRLGAAWRRPVFLGMKELCYFAYYTQPSHWPEIGYAGPLVGATGETTTWDPRYAKLVAPL